MAYTTADLERTAKRKSFAPTGQITFETSDILEIAWEQNQTEIVPALVKIREEYFVTYKDYAITAGKNRYPIPARSVGMIVREIAIVDGDRINPNFPRLEPDRLGSAAEGPPQGFYLQGDDIILYPTPSATTKTLRVFFHITPSEYVQTSAAAVIDTIDTGTNIITVSSIPSSWVTGNTFDLISATGSQKIHHNGMDLTSTLVSGNSITLPNLSDALAVGDYVALAGETPLINLPAELRPVLAQFVAAEMLEDMSQPGAGKAREKAEKLLLSQIEMLTPRVVGEDRTLTAAHWF